MINNRVIFRVESDVLSNMFVTAVQDTRESMHPVLTVANPNHHLYIISTNLDDFTKLKGVKGPSITVKNKLCLCLISKYPLFAIHQQILLQISSKKVGCLS